MISVSDILLLHEFSIRDFGGAPEIRDYNLLLSAINRPFQTFDGKDLYPGPFEKAAALGESLILNHPFIDGNKRTAFLAMIALLYEYGIMFNAPENETFDFVMAMSKGETNTQQIVVWLKDNSQNINT